MTTYDESLPPADVLAAGLDGPVLGPFADESMWDGEPDDPDAAPEPRGIVFTPASKIKLRRVRWLYDTTPEGAPPTSHGRIPMYCLVIAAGFPGLGKSQFGVWMTARITTGTLPGELFGTPRAVVYAAAEDSWSMTIAPRLVAAGADMDLVFRVDVQDTETAFARLTLPVDTSLLGKAAEEHSVALLVMDPLLSFIDKGVNDYRAAEVRQALEPLVAAADRHHFTILGLAHFTKSGAADPVSRVAGSGAFGQLIRALIAFAKEEGDDGDTRFVMSLEKNNLGRLGVPSHYYTIQPVTVDTDEGPTYVSKFVLGSETNTSVSDVMRDEANGGADRSERDEASVWLEDYLTTGDRAGQASPKDIQAASRAAGISQNALKEAKKRLKVQSVKGTGYHAGWFWTLPDYVPIADDSWEKE